MVQSTDPQLPPGSAAALTLFAALFLFVLTSGLVAQSAAQSAAPATPGAAAAATAMCRISGQVVSARSPLPGVAVVARSGDTGDSVDAVTSTDLDGRFELQVSAGAHTIAADLTGFTRVERPVTADMACPLTLDLQMVLAPRNVAVTEAAATPAGAAAGEPATAGSGGAAVGGRRGGRGQRFEALRVERQAAAGGVATGADTERLLPGGDAAVLALPPGFEAEGPTESVAITGDAADVNRGLLNDRQQALARGEFEGPGGAGVRGGAGQLPFAGPQGGPGGGPRGGPGGPPGGAGRGGPGGAGGRGLFGGRGGNQPRQYALTTSYTFGGSVLDSAPYQLRPSSSNANPDYLRQNVEISSSGPLLIPGIYDGTRRTNFNLSYTANRGATVFDQYGTVPTAAMRAGDFSALSRTLIDPSTGAAFLDNQIPASAFDPGALALLRYIPLPNVAAAARNFRHTTTTNNTGDNLSLRINHNFTPPPIQAVGGLGAGRGGAPGGGFRGGGAGRGQPAQANGANLTIQVQYRRNNNDRVNVIPTLGGVSNNSTLTVPATLNVSRQRVQHTFYSTITRSNASTVNKYAFISDVAGAAGIAGVSTDPFDWGVPALSFSSLSSLNDLTPSRRKDTRFTLGYGWSRTLKTHALHFGGDLQRDWSDNQTDNNARGAFVFTGLYSGSDFSDFLLGAPQQTSVQYGPGNVALRSRAVNLYAQDDWRPKGNLSFNLGLRYELIAPFTEANGRLSNLDVAPDFTAAAAVAAGGTGPFTGAFPASLIALDANNLAPRAGFAWRPRQGMSLRGGYGISYNVGSYAGLARQLASQPPYATTSTSIGTAGAPLDLTNPLAGATGSTANNFGIARDYTIGLVQTSNIDVTRDFSRVWTTGVGYTYIAGSGLDLVRAPNRGPDGLRIAGVQPFLWQTSEAASRLHQTVFRVRRRNTRGIGGGLTYTWSHSRDNASTLGGGGNGGGGGGGGTIVAQDDRNLAAEWGPSTFIREHQFSGNLNIELPFGPNRRWLNGGGVWAALLEAWSANLSFNAQSGIPLTARVLSTASEAARGTNGTLRADYNGEAVALDGRTIDRFFNTAAFSIPAAGTFGSAGRNMIVGPGSKDLSAQFSRDVRLPANRTLSVQLRASNLLNLVNYAGIDTVVNSPSFGQITSVRGMRTMQLNFRFRY